MKQLYLRRLSLFISSILICLLALSQAGSTLAQTENPIDEPLTADDELLQPPADNRALQFNGLNQYVTFGPAPHLGAETFTLELWFKWDGGGTTVNTGVDGVVAYPLLTKGRGEGDNTPADMNYFLGIRGSDKVLVADLEEGGGAVTPGQNHPITGVTPIVEGEWTHAAVTFDGRQWQMFLNGMLEAEIVVDQPIRSDSIQHAALATALNSKGVPVGFFDGALDEVRIWDKALSKQEIRANINAELSDPQPHLLARWGLDEETGNIVVDSAVRSGVEVDTAVTNSMMHVPGAPFNLAPNDAPALPVLVQPANTAVNIPTSPTLEVTVTDPEADAMTVTFYGRPLTTSNSDFTLVAMPDTQKYATSFSPIFAAQTQWIVDNKDALNIAHVMQLGDCVDNGDDAAEWEFADDAFSLLENPSTTGLSDGIPYSITVGNHDQTPFGVPDGNSTALYNQYFGSARFSGRNYYGGYYGSNFDNHYELFSAGGMDFIIVSLEYAGASTAVLDWVDNLLNTYSSRRAIIISHYLINTGNPGSWGGQGQAIYNALKDRPNLFLMHSGHRSGEGQRVDTYNGNTVNTIVADYQSRTNGGDGWLRILEFSPNNNEISIKTYSPTRDEYETDSNSQFTLSYEMQGAVDFQVIGQVSGVTSGTNASVTWSGLEKSTEYEWYVEVDDGSGTTTGPNWSFTTGSQQPPTVAFDGSPTSGPAPLTVNFSNLTTGDYETCSWDFDDPAGTSVSSACNDPAHTYNTPGTYSVSLSVDGPLGTDSTTTTDYIQVGVPAVAAFSANPTTGVAPQQVTFTNNTSGNYDTCNWNFGDGGTSSSCGTTVSHSYTTGGVFAVSLTVNGIGGKSTDTKAGYITIYETPTADFSGSPTSGPAPLTVNFSDLSTGDYDSCTWSFGDTNTSTLCDGQSNTYDQPGLYSVTLSVNGPGGADALTKTNYIQVGIPAVAAFSGSPAAGIAPQLVTFTNSSFGDFDTCLWDFGDSNTSSSCAANVSHTYTTGGVFAVSLTVNGIGGESTETKVDYITIYEAPTAEFSALPTAGPTPLMVQFTNLSSGDYDTCTWSFGDGSDSTTCVNPSHEYVNPGTYEVGLTVNGLGGEATVVKVDYIVAAVPVTADFSGGPTGGIAPLQVSFSNLATGDFDTCLWDFGDNSTSTDCANPEHVYTVAGSYTVSLTVSGLGGSLTATKPDYIMVNKAGNANFSVNPRQGLAPLTVDFTNLSLGNFDSCQWDFGDGNMSQNCNDPAHTYTTPGIYTVALAIDGSGGPDSVTYTNLIAVYEPVVADFKGDPTQGIGAFTVNFTNLSSGDYLTCLWDFGDDSSISQCDNPRHFYAEAGTYAVSLKVEGAGGTDTKTIAGYVTVVEASLSFSATPREGKVPLKVIFTNLSTGTYDTCLWRFGDGLTSSECDSASHTYTSPGMYTVELSLNGPSGSGSVKKIDFITVEPQLINLPLILRR